MTILNTSIPQMIRMAIENLDNARVTLNNINVFPVPDGDTGTNMYLTLNSARELIEQIDHTNTAGVSEIANSIFMNSKGNSGVILSSFLHGCLVTMTSHDENSALDWVTSFLSGYEKAYTSVADPREGTMLSVMRVISNFDTYDQLESMDLNTFWQQVVAEAWSETERTSEGLPALKAAEVIDSGAAGLTVLLFSFASLYTDQAQTKLTSEFIPWLDNYITKFNKVSLETYLKSTEIEEWGYCCQALVTNSGPQTSEDIKSILATFTEVGSLVISGTDSLSKLHFHASNPSEIFSALQAKYTLTEISTEDMDVQVTHHSLSQLFVLVNDPETQRIFEDGGQSVICCNPKPLSELINPNTTTSPVILSTNEESAAQLSSDNTLPAHQKILATNFPEALTACLFFDPDATTEVNTATLNNTLAELAVFTIDASTSMPFHEYSQKVTTLLTNTAPPPHSLITLYAPAQFHHWAVDSLRDSIQELLPSCEIDIYENPIPNHITYLTVE